MLNSYVGALSYADAFTFLFHSIRNPNQMLDICNEYADNYDINFNADSQFVANFVANQLDLYEGI